MSTKENNLKEKFKIALTSTAKVIADDFDVKKINSEEKKIKEFNFLEIDNLTSPADFIRLRAETDSSALKKKICNETIYKKNLPSNTSSNFQGVVSFTCSPTPFPFAVFFFCRNWFLVRKSIPNALSTFCLLLIAIKSSKFFYEPVI